MLLAENVSNVDRVGNFELRLRYVHVSVRYRTHIRDCTGPASAPSFTARLPLAVAGAPAFFDVEAEAFFAPFAPPDLAGAAACFFFGGIYRTG